MQVSRLAVFSLMVLAVSALGRAQSTVTAHVVLPTQGKKTKSLDASNAVIWLTPIDNTVLPSRDPNAPKPRLVQRNKSFEPHILVVPVGAQVEFPNRDPFFHNVFSLFEGKRFDLGLYEAGSTRDVLFDKPGISYIFCNIHAEMSAVVIAINTPYYGISDRKGQIVVQNVAAGRYILHTWHEAAMPETLNGMTREVNISDSTSTLGMLRLPALVPPQAHKNMYGRDYTPPAPGTPAYEHP